MSRELISETLNVSVEGRISDTRIQLNNDGQTVWNEADLVSVFYYSEDNLMWQFQGNTGDRNGNLRHIEGNRGAQTMGDVVVVYPYRYDNEILPSESLVKASLPHDQYYSEHSYGSNGNIMVAKSASRSFTLRSVCGWVKLQLTGEGKRVRRVSLCGNNEEQVAGHVYVDYATADITFAEDASYGSYCDIYRTTTVECPDVELHSSEPTPFYIAVLPQTFEKGLTVDVEFEDGSLKTLTRSEELTVKRNHIVPMDSVSVGDSEDGDEVADVAHNEIVMLLNTEMDIVDIVADINLEAFDVELSNIRYTSNTYNFEFSGDITHIGDFAFRGCDWIEEVYLPNSLETMGVGVFAQCPKIEAIYSKYSTPDNRAVVIDDTLVAFAAHRVEGFAIDYAKHIGDYTFSGCEELVDVSFLDGVETIGAWSFRDCINLQTAYFGSDVETIGEGAFFNCPKVTFYGKFSKSEDDGNNIQDEDGKFVGVVTPPDNGDLDLGDSTGVVEGAMQNSNVVTRLTIPESVTSISAWAFDGCVNLKTVICKPLVPPTAIYSSTGEWAAFDNNAEGRKFYVPAESVEAYKSAEGWRDYAEWIFPLSSAPEDDDEEEVEVVSEILYTNGSTTVPTELYKESGFDATIVSHRYDETRGYWVIGFDKELTVVGEMAFNFVEGVTRVIIPEGVKRIEHAAFYCCENLESITLPESLEEVDESVFAYCNMLEKFEGECRAIADDGRCVIIDNTFRGFAFACGVTEYTIPSGVIRIGNGSFRGCDTLTRIVVPEGVEVIEYSAFSICDCLEYQLPESLKTIAEHAFSSNYMLRSITIPQNVNYIGEYAFGGCFDLETFYCNASQVPTLGNNVFKGYIDGGLDYIGCEIRVPAESVEAYKAAEGWSEYADYIVAM